MFEFGDLLNIFFGIYFILNYKFLLYAIAVIIIASKLYFMVAITTEFIILEINFYTLLVIVIKFIIDKQLLAELLTILGSYLEFIKECIVAEQDINKFI